MADEPTFLNFGDNGEDDLDDYEYEEDESVDEPEGQPEEGTQPEPFDPDTYRREIEDEIARALAEEDTNSGVFKGMQRQLSKRDRELQELRQQNMQMAQMMAQIQRQVEDQGQFDGFVSETLYDALDEDSRERMEKKLLEARLQRAERAYQQPQYPPQAYAPQQWQQQYQPQPQVDIEQVKQTAEKQFREEATAWLKSQGVDPKDKRLQWGSFEEGHAFYDRLRMLRESTETIRQQDMENEVDGVRPKRRSAVTRGQGIEGSPTSQEPELRGTQALSKGAADVLASLQQMRRGRTRK